MSKRPLIRARKYNWIFPLIVFVMGILHFSNISYDIVSTAGWYILMPLAVLLFVIGIVQHLRWTEKTT